MVPLSAYVAVSAVLFITGLLGVVIRRNFIIVLMSVEVMLNAANINHVAFGSGYPYPIHVEIIPINVQGRIYRWCRWD